jgi:hypothetical protein
VSVRFASDDARRGGLIVLGASGDDGADIARRYANGGYEAVVAAAGEPFEPLAASLEPPVFVLALPDAAAETFTINGVAAVSIIADARIGSRVALTPKVPAIIHLDPEAHAKLAGKFEAAQPELPVHLHVASEDGERLLLLRTLRLFSSAGGRGEV